MIKGASEIGFGQEVSTGRRSFYIQTEVLAGGHTALTMRSLVLENGVVRDSFSAPFPITKDLVEAERIVKRQHQDMVDKVLSGRTATP